MNFLPFRWKYVIDECELLQTKIAKIIGGANTISLSADIATTKGMRYSYLGITAHVWYKSKYFSVALDIAEMLDAHRAVYIREMVQDLLRAYKIAPSRICKITTDGASNMQAAFISPFPGALAVDDTEIATVDELAAVIEMYVDNANHTETEIPIADVPASKQFKCAAHRLQLVLKDVFEIDMIAINVRKVAFSILGKFAKSHDATKKLFESCGKKLMFPANTRWSSLHITYSRLLEISEDVNKIAKQKGWPEISDADLNTMRLICKLVAPFRAFTDKLQSDNVPTISLLSPGIKGLIKCLSEQNRQLPDINDELIHSLETRFADVLSSGSPSGDPIYLVAAYLDPAVFRIMENDDVLAESEIRKMCSNFETNVANSSQANCTEIISASADLLGFSVNLNATTAAYTFDTEITTFLTDRRRPYFSSATAAEYWDHNRKVYPTLCKLAYEVLCVPATSASVERMFSQMTLHTTGHKGNTGPELTRAKVLMNYNRRFLD